MDTDKHRSAFKSVREPYTVRRPFVCDWIEHASLAMRSICGDLWLKKPLHRLALASPQPVNQHPRMKLFAAILLASAISLSAEPAKVNLPGAQVETYKLASGDELKLYIFNPKGHRPGKDRRPAIVFFFGGGWNGGTPTQFQQHSRYLASRGMVAAVADYRVKSRQRTPPSACVQDGKSALRYLRKNARRLGINPVKIAAGGGSAGGHVAAATGIIDKFEDKADDLDWVSKANALVLFNPVYDNGPDGGYGHSRVKDYWKDISPAHNITEDDPPAVVFLGTKNPLIHVVVAQRFQAKMKALDIKSDLHLYEGQPHGFFNESKGGTKIFLDTLRKMDRFLVEIGYLEGRGTEAQMKAVSSPPKPKKPRKAKKSSKSK